MVDWLEAKNSFKQKQKSNKRMAETITRETKMEGQRKVKR
jgi:hypothetical protein